MAQTIGRNCRFLQGPDTDKMEVCTHRIVMMYSNDEDGCDDFVWLMTMRRIRMNDAGDDIYDGYDNNIIDVNFSLEYHLYSFI
jgi:hypothetical protein